MEEKIEDTNIEKAFTFKGYQIKKEKQKRPIKLLIYGENGTGKTTLASQAKNPIFIDMEGNSGHLDISRYPLSTFEGVESFIGELLSQDHDYKTLVIDSLDALEHSMHSHVNDQRRYSDQQRSYGKNWQLLSNHTHSLLKSLDALRKKGMDIIIIAHSSVDEVENPLTGNHKRFVLRIDERISGPIRDWVNGIFFITSDKTVDDNGRPAQGKTRSIYTNGDSGYIAKNTWNLLDSINYKSLKHNTFDYIYEQIDQFFDNEIQS